MCGFRAAGIRSWEFSCSSVAHWHNCTFGEKSCSAAQTLSSLSSTASVWKKCTQCAESSMKCAENVQCALNSYTRTLSLELTCVCVLSVLPSVQFPGHHPSFVLLLLISCALIWPFLIKTSRSSAIPACKHMQRRNDTNDCTIKSGILHV